MTDSVHTPAPNAPVTDKPAANGRRAAIVAAVGGLLVLAAIGWVLRKADIGVAGSESAQPSITFVAKSDLGAAATTLMPSAATASMDGTVLVWNLRPEKQALPPGGIAAAWDSLAANGRDAAPAVWVLVDHPAEAVAWIRQKVKPVRVELDAEQRTRIAFEERAPDGFEPRALLGVVEDERVHHLERRVYLVDAVLLEGDRGPPVGVDGGVGWV